MLGTQSEEETLLIFTYQLRAGFTCLNTDDLCHLGCHSLRLQHDLGESLPSSCESIRITWGHQCQSCLCLNSSLKAGYPGSQGRPQQQHQKCLWSDSLHSLTHGWFPTLESAAKAPGHCKGSLHMCLLGAHLLLALRSHFSICTLNPTLCVSPFVFANLILKGAF